MKRREENEYLEKVKGILTSNLCFSRVSNGPAQLLDHLYIGSKDDAQKLSYLKCLKITHVLNCAASTDYSTEFGKSPYANTGIAYEEFEARDVVGYPILMHFTKARDFIDRARCSGGRVLVHCELGVNRSGAICVAYMMVNENITLFEALRRAKMERPVILCNEGFQRQLIQFADDKNLLEKA